MRCQEFEQKRPSECHRVNVFFSLVSPSDLGLEVRQSNLFAIFNILARTCELWVCMRAPNKNFFRGVNMSPPTLATASFLFGCNLAATRLAYALPAVMAPDSSSLLVHTLRGYVSCCVHRQGKNTQHNHDSIRATIHTAPCTNPLTRRVLSASAAAVQQLRVTVERTMVDQITEVMTTLYNVASVSSASLIVSTVLMELVACGGWRWQFRHEKRAQQWAQECHVWCRSGLCRIIWNFFGCVC